MGVVGADRGDLAAGGEELVDVVPALGLVVETAADLVVGLDRVGGGDALQVRDGGAVPLRVREGDERAGVGRALGDIGAGLSLTEAAEIRGKANGDDVPVLAVGEGRGVEFGPDEGGEGVGTTGRRVGDRLVIGLQKMVGNGHEVVALLPVGGADRGRRHPAVRVDGVGMDIPPVEAPRAVTVKQVVCHKRCPSSLRQ